MAQFTDWKRKIWFWGGVALLTLSVLTWLVLIIMMISGVRGAEWMMLIGIVLTIIPITIGIYAISPDAPGLQEARGVLRTGGYAFVFVFLRIKHFLRGKSNWYRAGAPLLFIVALSWLVLVLVSVVEPKKMSGNIIFDIVFLTIPIGITIYVAKRVLDYAKAADSKEHGQWLDEGDQPRLGLDARFSMRVEEAFPAAFVTGETGVVVEGIVGQGSIQKGDALEILGIGYRKKARVFDVDTCTGYGGIGEKIRLLIEGVTAHDVWPGDMVVRV